MNDVEQRLTDAGQRWREEGDVHEAVTRVQQNRLPRRRSRPVRPPRRLTVAVVAAAVVLAAVGIAATVRHPVRSGGGTGAAGGIAASPRPPAVDGSEGTGVYLPGLVVHDGEKVRAFGQAYRAGDGRTELCGALESGAAGPGDPTSAVANCEENHQRIAYLAGLPHPVEDGAGVTVTGVLDGDTITVSAVSDRDEPSREVFPTVPCAAPAGGWPDGGTTDGQGALIKRVTAEPDRYGELWLADIPGRKDPGGSPLQVLTVGTVGDVAAARHELQPLAIGRLCVYEVRNSQRQLDAARAVADRVLRPVALNPDVPFPVSIDAVPESAKRLTADLARQLQPYTNQLALVVHIVPEG